MKRLLTLLCIALTVPTALSVRADTGEISHYELNDHFPTYDSRFSIDFSWIVERYDFDRIEKYIDEYYGARYKYWEKYLTSKQRELASKFGLSNIHVKPNFRCYEDTKVVFSRRIWNDRLLVRYLAPAGDIRDFELLVALKPHRFATFIVKGHINGERSMAIVVKKPFGSESGNRDAMRRARRLLGKARKLVE